MTALVITVVGGVLIVFWAGKLLTELKEPELIVDQATMTQWSTIVDPALKEANSIVPGHGLDRREQFKLYPCGIDEDDHHVSQLYAGGEWFDSDPRSLGHEESRPLPTIKIGAGFAHLIEQLERRDWVVTEQVNASGFVTKFNPQYDTVSLEKTFNGERVVAVLQVFYDAVSLSLYPPGVPDACRVAER